MPYGNIHRFLLRTIASQSVMSVEDVKKLLEKKTGNDEANLQLIIQEINENIKPIHQMIKIVNDEGTSEQLVVFQSLGFDDTSKAQNFFSPVELEFYRLLMDQIMYTHSREINEMTAICLVNNIKVNNRLLSIERAQTLLDTWCRLGYLHHEDKKYALGVRAIHEFESYFLKAIADSDNLKCCICNAIVFRGYNCPFCPRTIHNRCLDASLKNKQIWPCCKEKFTYSQLQELRERSSRPTGSSSRDTQELESTQRLVETQQLNENFAASMSIEDSPEEREMDEDDSIRPKKKRRLNK